MKKELSIIKQRIVKKGVFDLNKTVKEMKEFLKDSKYTIGEKQNVSKVLDRGVESTTDFIAERDIDDFYAYKINIDFLVTNLNKTTSNEKRMDRGEIEIRMKGILILDHKNKFHGWLGNFMFKLYERYVIKDVINSVHCAKLYVDFMAVFDLLKHNLDLD